MGSTGTGSAGRQFYFDTFLYFNILADSTLLTDMSIDTVQFSQSSGPAHIASSSCLLRFILQRM